MPFIGFATYSPNPAEQFSTIFCATMPDITWFTKTLTTRPIHENSGIRTPNPKNGLTYKLGILESKPWDLISGSPKSSRIMSGSLLELTPGIFQYSPFCVSCMSLVSWGPQAPAIFTNPHMSHSLVFEKGVIWGAIHGATIGRIQEDARSSDYSSCG